MITILGNSTTRKVTFLLKNLPFFTFSENFALTSEAYNELGPPVSFMTGSYDNNSSPHHMQPPQDPYNVPPYGNYVQPPLGSDSGSGQSGYVPMPPGGFSPVTSAASKDFMDASSVSQMHGNAAAAAAMMHEPWNNNEHRLETTYDCY